MKLEDVVNQFEEQLENNPIVGILMRARDVPEGHMVTKPTGQKLYSLEKQIRIFHTDEGKPPQLIKADNGTLFLVNGADINAINENKLVMWRPAGLDIVEYWLQDLREGTPQ